MAVHDYRAQGYVPEAIVNHLALLGWSSGTDEEIFTLEELAARFDLSRVQQGGAIFDRQRLDWLNGQWIRRLPDDELVERALPFLADGRGRRPQQRQAARMPTDDDLRALLPLVRERLPRLDAVGPLLAFIFVED